MHKIVWRGGVEAAAGHVGWVEFVRKEKRLLVEGISVPGAPCQCLLTLTQPAPSAHYTPESPPSGKDVALSSVWEGRRCLFYR